MLQKVQLYIETHQLLTQGKPVIVAVSGGADSIALWHILQELGYKCVIAHCNFHLRDEESNRDERFVSDLAKKYNTLLYKIDFNTVKYAKDNAISIEMAARDLRYEWFYKLARDLDAQSIAVAHHADDNVETMLMNLVRGTGMKGLTGIPKRNNLIVRPLLCCTRSEIELYLTKAGLDYVTDSTNMLVEYQRNKIRNIIIPALEEINPSVRHTLYNTIEHFDEIYSIYQKAVEAIVHEVVSTNSEYIKINIEKLKQQNEYKTILFEILYPLNFNPAIIQQVVESLDRESGKEFFSESHCLIKDRKELIVCEKKVQSEEAFLINKDSDKISKPINITFERFLKTSEFQVSREKNRIHVDYSKLKFPLKLRKWNEGDVFFPFGLNGNKKKVSDFFVDNKLSLFEKEKCWLLLSGEEIIWIVGYRTDERFRITEETKEVLQISLS